MRRVLKEGVFLILFFGPIILWIYFKSLSSMLKEEIVEVIPDETEGNETLRLDIKHILLSNHKIPEEDLQQINEDEKYLKYLKELLRGNISSRDVKFEEDFLRLFLANNDYHVQQAFSKIQNFLVLRKEHNYFFHNLSFDFSQNPAYRFATILPHHREDGSATILVELGKWDPDKVPLLHFKQVLFIICFQELRNPVTQANGISFIYDFTDVGFKYVKHATPENLYLLHHVSFEIAPVKFVGYHLVNLNVFGNLLVTLTRPFLPKFIENVFYTHSSLDELFDFFPRSMLPVHYGGTLKDYYAGDWIRRANERHGHYPAGGQKNIFEY